MNSTLLLNICNIDTVMKTVIILLIVANADKRLTDNVFVLAQINMKSTSFTDRHLYLPILFQWSKNDSNFTQTWQYSSLTEAVLIWCVHWYTTVRDSNSKSCMSSWSSYRPSEFSSWVLVLSFRSQKWCV